MQSHLSKFRRRLKFVGLLLLGVLSTCYIAEVEAARVSLTFRGTVSPAPGFHGGLEYPPESGVVAGMPVEGEVWWDPEEMTQGGSHSCEVPQLDCFSQYQWSYILHNPFPNHGFAIRIGRHVMTADPFSFVMTVSNHYPVFGSAWDRIKFEVVGNGQDCPSPIVSDH